MLGLHAAPVRAAAHVMASSGGGMSAHSGREGLARPLNRSSALELVRMLLSENVRKLDGL